MAFVQKKQLSSEIRDILDSVGGTNQLLLTMTRHLSACGWRFNFTGHVWEKGEHSVTDEALRNVAKYWPAMWPWMKEQLTKGAVGFAITHGEITGEEDCYGASVKVQWPSAVDVLSGIEE